MHFLVWSSETGEKYRVIIIEIDTKKKSSIKPKYSELVLSWKHIVNNIPVAIISSSGANLAQRTQLSWPTKELTNLCWGTVQIFTDLSSEAVAILLPSGLKKKSNLDPVWLRVDPLLLYIYIYATVKNKTYISLNIIII